MGNASFSNFQNNASGGSSSSGGLMRRFMSQGGQLNQSGFGQRSASSARMVTSTSVNNTPMLSALNRHPQMHSTSALNQFSNNSNNNSTASSAGGGLPISSFLSKNKQRSSGSLNTMGNTSNNMGMNMNSKIGNSSFSSGPNPSMNARLLASMEKNHQQQQQQQQQQNSGGGSMRQAQSMSAMNSFKPSNPIPNTNNNNNTMGNSNSIGNRLFPNGLVSAVSSNSMQQQNFGNSNSSGSSNNMFSSHGSSSNMMPSKYSQSSGNLGMMRSSSSRSMSSAVQSNMARLMGGGSAQQMNNNQGNNSYGQQKQPNAFMAMLQKQEQQNSSSNINGSNIGMMNHNNLGMMNNNTNGMDGMNRKRTLSQSDLSSAGPVPKMQRSMNSSTGRKNNATASTNSLLHSSCKLYPKTKVVLESALAFDPQAIRRPVPLTVGEKKGDKERDGDDDKKITPSEFQSLERDQKLPETESNEIKHTSNSNNEDESKDKENKKSYRSTEWYSYPFNIAMKHGAGLDVLQFLAKEGADVLVQPDGEEELCALGVALSMGKPSVDVVRLILAANPSTRSVADRRANYPLHTAVRAPMLDASPDQRLEIVRLVYAAYSQALEKRNFRGETPLDIAIRSPFSCDEVIDFLLQKSSPEESTIVEEAPLV